MQQAEASQRAAANVEAHQAWLYATRYETFLAPLLNARMEPKRDMLHRSIWVKSFQKSDVKSLGKSRKYGNEAYQVNGVIAFHDALSADMILKIGTHISAEQEDGLVKGVWTPISMQCTVEALDGGGWTVSDYHFAPLSGNPDFPLEMVHEDK